MPLYLMVVCQASYRTRVIPRGERSPVPRRRPVSPGALCQLLPPESEEPADAGDQQRQVRNRVNHSERPNMCWDMLGSKPAHICPE